MEESTFPAQVAFLAPYPVSPTVQRALALAALAQTGSKGRVMMISQLALLCLEASWQHLLRRSRGAEDSLPAPDGPVLAKAVAARIASDRVILSASEESRPLHRLERRTGSFAPQNDVVSPDPTLAPPATGLSQTAGEQTNPTDPLTAAERRARAAALRALALSRARRFDAARAAFTDAARLDPMLDLTRTPAFWKLERAAHEAAIDAYVAVGRDRDAAVLRARIRSTFRPKALRPRREAAFSP